jgi:hypothetical protein
MRTGIEALILPIKNALTSEYEKVFPKNKNLWGLAILSGLLKELRKKNEKLKALRDFLRPLGLNYQEWLLEFEGVLRDADWNQQYEPGLNRIEIQSVGQAMQVLANRIFGRTEFSYAELAAEARVGSVEVVRRIVRRLALWKGDAKKSCSLILEPNGWSLLEGSPPWPCKWLGVSSSWGPGRTVSALAGRAPPPTRERTSARDSRPIAFTSPWNKRPRICRSSPAVSSGVIKVHPTQECAGLRPGIFKA